MKQNIRYKHACLTKLALIAGLLFIALWLNFSFGNPETDFRFSPDSVGNFHTERTGDATCRVERLVFTTKTLIGELSGKTAPLPEYRKLEPIARGQKRLQVEILPPRPACPQNVATPASLGEPKISVAEIYARLIDERHVKWEPPPCLPGNTQEDRLLW